MHLGRRTAARTSGALALAAGVAGCGAFDLDVHPPPTPEGFPSLAASESAKAELVVDGENYVTDYSLGATVNVEGGFEDELRARLDLDRLDLTFRDLEVGTWWVEQGDLEATWDSLTADAGCGAGRIEIAGLRSYDAGLHGDQDYFWGTVQLELCEIGYGDTVPDYTVDVTGRFTAIVDYR